MAPKSLKLAAPPFRPSPLSLPLSPTSPTTPDRTSPSAPQRPPRSISPPLTPPLTPPALTCSHDAGSPSTSITRPRSGTPPQGADQASEHLGLQQTLTQSNTIANTVLRPKQRRDPPTPPDPLPWLWQCHLCSRTYPLGTTRRCLEDGHYFCAGEQSLLTVRGEPLSGAAARRAKCGKACASEFDYGGWRAWGTWRRSCASSNGEEKDSGSPVSGCEAGCDYPSECRWSKKRVTLPQSEPSSLIDVVYAGEGARKKMQKKQKQKHKQSKRDGNVNAIGYAHTCPGDDRTEARNEEDSDGDTIMHDVSLTIDVDPAARDREGELPPLSFEEILGCVLRASPPSSSFSSSSSSSADECAVEDVELDYEQPSSSRTKADSATNKEHCSDFAEKNDKDQVYNDDMVMSNSHTGDACIGMHDQNPTRQNKSTAHPDLDPHNFWTNLFENVKQEKNRLWGKAAKADEASSQTEACTVESRRRNNRGSTRSLVS